MKAQLFFSTCFTLVISVFLSSCAPSPPASTAETETMTPIAKTYADSVAIRAVNALGGRETFNKLPALQFNFGFERDGKRVVRNKHLWDKLTGGYRLEYIDGADSSYVIVFNVNTKEGKAYLNGDQMEETEAEGRIKRAYRSFINDVYWLQAPMKMMDPGVIRTYLADSSTATTDVVKLSFQGVGLTPGDQYWMYVDKASGQLSKWSYVLQGNPDAAPRAAEWLEYETFQTEAGSLTFATRKKFVGSFVGSNASIMTDGIKVFDKAPADMMTNPAAML